MALLITRTAVRLDRCNKSVSEAGHSFNEPRALGGVAESLPQPGDGAVQPVIEPHERIGRPKPLAQRFLCYNIACMFDQDR